MGKELTEEWTSWLASNCLKLTINHWTKHGINMPLILKDQWATICILCEQNPSNDDAKILQEGLVHNIATLAEAHYKHYDEATASEIAELTSRVKYMESTDLNAWSLKGFIEFINASKVESTQ